MEPKTLTETAARDAAFKCLEVLRASGIHDVEVELRESTFVQSAGPKLFRPRFNYRVDPNPDLTIEVLQPLTHALSLPIAAQATPYIDGTGGFFMAKGDGSNKLLLITTRHVVLSDNPSTEKFERKHER